MNGTFFLSIIKRLPIVGSSLLRALTRIQHGQFRDSPSYWENRYTRGGTSGAGSYGEHAEFKARTLNGFIREHNIGSVIEFGCGDGNQLSLIQYPRYIGLDVSPTAIELCQARFADDATKSFQLYKPADFTHRAALLTAELSLSLDVIYHIVEDEIFKSYLLHLFSAATRFVIIFSSDTEKNPPGTAPHVKHRRFSDTIARNISGWKLIQKIPNEAARHDDQATSETSADFYIYEKTIVPSN